MANVYAQENLSTEIIQNQFRDPIQSEADDGTAPLTDLNAGERGSDDPDFVLPSFPSQGALYPHVIVSEAGYNHSHPDARADFTEGEYDVEIRVLARSTTTLNQITDGVRHWFVNQFDTLVANGYNDPEIIGGGEVPNPRPAPIVEGKTVITRGTVYTQ